MGNGTESAKLAIKIASVSPKKGCKSMQQGGHTTHANISCKCIFGNSADKKMGQ